MKRFYYAFFILFFFSCGNEKNNESDQNSEGSWELQKIDSVDYKLLGDPILADVSQDGSRILIYDYAASEIISLDQSGKLLGKFSKTEDTPDAYGFMMELPGFLGNDQVVINGMRGIFIYDFEGNLTKEIKHPEAVGGAAFMPQVGKSIETFTYQNQEFILSKSVRPRDTYPGEQAFYDRFRALEWINVASGESTEIIPFETGSIFKNGKGYIESDYTPSFEWIDGKLYVSLGGESILRIYDMDGESVNLDTAINLSIPEFRELPVRERNEFSEGSITVDGSTPSIRNIHRLGDKLILHYYAGMDPEKTKEAGDLWRSGNEEEAEILFEQLEENVKKGFLVFDLETLQMLDIVDLPQGVDTGGFLATGNSLWFQKATSEEVEEDFVRIYEYKLD
jgi:hypothetical protein